MIQPSQPLFEHTLQSLLSLPAPATTEHWVVGALIIHPSGQIFVQKRSSTRLLFPNCWDLVGGHVEAGETLEQALRREIQEETGWQLLRILALVDLSIWQPEDQITRHEADFLVEVTGDLVHPQLEWSKHPEFRWITPADLEILHENRAETDAFIYDVVKKGFALLPS